MSKPVILTVINTSWGAVDWVLPVLSHIHEEAWADLVVYFKTEEARRREDQFQDLAERLGRIAAVLDAGDLTAALSPTEKARLVGQTLAQDRQAARRGLSAYGYAGVRLAALPCRRSVWRSSKIPDSLTMSLLRRRLQGRRVACLLHDFGARHDEALHQAFPEAKVFVFPHGTNWWDESTQLGPEPTRWMRTMSPEAVWLTGWAGDERYFRNHGLRCRVVACGQPKFDPLWVRKICAPQRPPAPRASAGERSLTMLFLSRPLGKSTSKEQTREDIAAVLRVAARHRVRVLVKLHPNQRRKEVEPLLRAAGLADCDWRNTSVLAAATEADFAVALPSSAVMDAGAAGIPSFEYFDYSDQWYVSFVKDGDKTTSIYRREGLAEPVDTEPALDAWIARIRHEPHVLRELAERQQAALTRLLPIRAGAIEKATALLRDATLRSSQSIAAA